MAKDKLNIDLFITKNGKNYRKSETANKTEIKNYFLKKGFNVLNIKQLWRHIHGKLEKNNKIFFFKMSSTPGIGERTQNEVSWNKQICELIKKFNIDYFNVPKIYDYGHYQEKFYYLSSYYSGQFLSQKNPFNIKNLSKWIDKIVKTNLFFLSLKNIKFYRDKDSKNLIEKWDDYFKKNNNRYEEIKENQLENVINEVKNLKNTYTAGVNHGDFVPWHMIQDTGKFTLIDGEHASSQTPRYYDICYFYHRVYTSANAPKFAKYYLSKIRQSIPLSEKNKFDISIRPILASRIIGGFWDAKTNGLKDLTYHNQLKKDFSKNNLY